MKRHSHVWRTIRKNVMAEHRPLVAGDFQECRWCPAGRFVPVDKKTFRIVPCYMLEKFSLTEEPTR